MRQIETVDEVRGLAVGSVIGYIDPQRTEPLVELAQRDKERLWRLLLSGHYLYADDDVIGAAQPGEHIVVLFDAGEYRAIREALAHQEALPTEAIVIRGSD